MSVASSPQNSTKSVHEVRKILGPAGNRAICVPPAEIDPENPKKQPQQQLRKPTLKMPDSAVRKNASVDSSCSSDSSSSSGIKTPPSLRKREKSVSGRVKIRHDKVCPDELATAKPAVSTGLVRRCEWITANSGPKRVSCMKWARSG